VHVMLYGCTEYTVSMDSSFTRQLFKIMRFPLESMY
jgi:hypothetical protein